MHEFNKQDNRFYLLLSSSLSLLLPSSLQVLFAREMGGSEVDYGEAALEHEMKGMCFV